jgi:hypothetical protein
MPGHVKLMRSRVLFAVVILGGCSETPRTESGAGDTITNQTAPSPVPERQLTGNRVAGIRFDPTAVAAGAKVGAMTLDSIAVRTAFDSTRVGTAWFSGSVELSGAKLRHFDADSDGLCFEADSASAARLPRWQGDERRSWFCFTNRRAAQAALGPPGDSARATVVIDRLTIHRGMSDEVNSARFVRALTR